MPTNRNTVSKMKSAGVAILAADRNAAGAFARYKLVESSMILVTLPVNILGISSIPAALRT